MHMILIVLTLAVYIDLFYYMTMLLGSRGQYLGFTSDVVQSKPNTFYTEEQKYKYKYLQIPISVLLKSIMNLFEL